jgi:hypothetical protein
MAGSIGGGQVGVDNALAVFEDIADARQRNLAHQHIERTKGDGEPQQLAGEGSRIEGREDA